MASFNNAEWQKISTTLTKCLAQEKEPFGLPEKREKSVLLGTFNIRELGKVENRTQQAWDFLKMICERFDLLAIQEVQDNLDGIRHLHKGLGSDFGLVVSDTTGNTPGSSSGSTERLAFLFRWARIRRTELASDISYDRTTVVETLFENREIFSQAWNDHLAKLKSREKTNKEREVQGKKKLPEPGIILPRFLTFIRQPHCASFEVVPQVAGAKPFEFLVVNVHLLYGEDKQERQWEFEALIEWLTMRAKMRDAASYENIIMMGDCNLEFEDTNVKREEIDEWLKELNSTKLKGKKAAKVNFPLLDPHPILTRNPIRTNARQNQTYDQIAIFAHDERLPDYKANETAGSQEDGYDYGVFKYTDLFAQALFDGQNFDQLTKQDQNSITRRTEWDISDHMPAWFRLPIP